MPDISHPSTGPHALPSGYPSFSGQYNRIGRVLYWGIAALLLFFIFSNRNYDIQIRLVLVSLLIVVSYLITLAINRYLIPQLLFRGRIFRFLYALFAVFILTLWIISLLIFLILLYSAANLPNAIIPQRSDVLILISGNYLIVVMAAVIHFIRESYHRQMEKNDIARQKQETEIKLKEAQLKLLQGQIHPHFIYNMLNNLYGLVRHSPGLARKMIIQLSGLLDYMLYDCNQEFVPLESEIRFIRNYIELEHIRRPGDLDIQAEFPESADGVQIAPLILFPFVENAFKHGLHATDPYIDMRLSIYAGALHFEVFNRIAGQASDKFLRQEGHGIGLKNIRERLELIYPGRHVLNIQPADADYTVHLQISPI